jgi:2-dehydropantoate 2-reductase
MANALAGITGMGSAAVRKEPAAFPVCLKIACEALTVAQTLGVHVEAVGGLSGQRYLDAGRGVGREELRATWAEAGQSLGAGRPSLLQDMMKGRRTEVDYLNGYVVCKGREAGVPTPVNEAVVAITKRVETGELAQDPANLQLLTTLL